MSDADSEELTQLQYLIVSGNDRGLFVINTTTGDIATTADIDREEGETHTLIIEVSETDQQRPFIHSLFSLSLSLSLPRLEMT